MTLLEAKNKVLSEASIINVVGRYVKLKRVGQEMLGLCPFHEERTPSFSVNEKKKIFKCFGCGKQGDAIHFIQEIERKPFLEALLYIAGTEGIKIELGKQDDQDKKEIVFVPKKDFEKTLLGNWEKQGQGVGMKGEADGRIMSGCEAHPFLFFLSRICNEREINEIAYRYFLGFQNPDAVIFWQIDKKGRIRTGQKIRYDKTGHRIKNYVPIRLYTEGKGYKPCLFGEHLLKNWTRQHLVGIVESEKTACLCSHFMPVLHKRPVIWLASSGSNGLTKEKIEVLRGMDIVLVPDYSYVARAIWGSTEMRKKNINDKTVIDPEGEIDKDFIPAKIKIALIAKSVSFFDNFPFLNNGTDIGDWLVQLPPLSNSISEFEIPDLPFS